MDWLPCQPFSRSGKNLGARHPADNGRRGILFNAAYDFMSNRSPRAFGIEIMSHLVQRHRKVFNSWMDHLKRLKRYNIIWAPVRTDHNGIPQRRVRL